MRYRENKRTGDRVSEIGLGASSIHEAGFSEGLQALRAAFEGGINYFDLAAGEGEAFSLYGEALRDVRSSVFYQVHFGAEYSQGTYGWTLDLEMVKRSLDWQLKALRTDYVDYGFIHCQDELSDWETYQKNQILDYLLRCKESGVVHHIGLSSHTPEVIHQILDSGLVDMLMFSINPAYDYQRGEFANGSIDEREGLYRRCQSMGVGISCMKPFSGGQLLDEKTSPYPVALTKAQCLRYCLDKPGVLTVLPGVRSLADVRDILAYETASEEETDWSQISSFAPAEARGRCVYCNHCKPCPQGLDVGLINKYYDLSLAGDILSGEHYRTLERKASDCVACGHCEERCPFHVGQIGRMEKIRDHFGC